MSNKDMVLRTLDGVLHPDTGEGLASGGMVAEVSVDGFDGSDTGPGDAGGRIEVVLKFRRARDPFAASMRRQAVDALRAAFPEAEVFVSVEAAAIAAPIAEPSRKLPGVKHIIAVASGKGGVGKSTVTANLAVTLASMGYRVGVLDADIYGPSQPQLFGAEGYLPSVADDGVAGSEASESFLPAESMGVKIMSIGFFIGPDNALVWRGPMANSALRQLIHQTAWGELDYLLVDLPPGTGDIHLSIVHELALDGAVVVSTPGRLALADVKRGVEMFRSEGISVPVLGIVENMAWFTPRELPDNKYYIFGRAGAHGFAEKEGIEFLGEIPLVLSSSEEVGGGFVVGGVLPEVASCYVNIARKVVDKLGGLC